MLQHYKIPVKKTAHVYTMGIPSTDIKHLWIVAHGYGQLANKFIKWFNPLLRDDILVIAPEGLSRFYWGGFDGDVVSSWMTKGDRLDEITDYSNYMQQVYDEFIPQLATDATITLLGFSQGCATQVRWILQKYPYFHNLILWAGTFPEDIDYHNQPNYWLNKKIYYVYGTEDPFLPEARLKWCFDVIEEKNINVEIHTYRGKHTIPRDAFNGFLQKTAIITENS